MDKDWAIELGKKIAEECDFNICEREIILAVRVIETTADALRKVRREAMTEARSIIVQETYWGGEPMVKFIDRILDKLRESEGKV